MKAAAKPIFNLTLTGRLSLDFTNTVDWRTGDDPRELLNSYADLIRWARHVNVLTSSDARHCLRLAARHPQAALAALKRARSMREAIFRIVSSIAGGRQAPKADLRLLNENLSEAFSHLGVVPARKGFAWEWKLSDDRLDGLLWPIARDAAELLVDSETLPQVRECAGEGCGWLFVDTSRNRSRRWCTMGICGNRAKARRHYRHLRAIR